MKRVHSIVRLKEYGKSVYQLGRNALKLGRYSIGEIRKRYAGI